MDYDGFSSLFANTLVQKCYLHIKHGFANKVEKCVENGGEFYISYSICFLHSYYNQLVIITFRN